MTQLEFLTRYIFDQGISLSRNLWLLPFVSSHLARRLKGFQPDTYVVSYPKSGRTWLRMILMSYYSLAQNLSEINWSILEKIPGKTVVFNHADGTWRPMPKKIGRLRISSKFSSKKIILLVRDPRDVLVSNWYHLTFRYSIYKQDLSEFIREDLLGVEKIIHFMNLWVDQKASLKDLLIIHYENMKFDTETEVKKVLGFIGEKEIDPARLKNAIADTTFEKMRKMEALGQHNPFSVPSNLHDWRSFKCRKGIVGDWRNHLNHEDMAFLDERISSQLRKEFGYSDSFQNRSVTCSLHKYPKFRTKASRIGSSNPKLGSQDSDLQLPKQEV
jgi:hypothetical protein